MEMFSLFSNLGALGFSEKLIRYSLHICLREVKSNLFLDALASLKTMFKIQLLMFSRLLDFKSITEYYRVLQSITQYYRVLQSITEYYRVLQSITEYYRVFQSITKYYKVLQSITKTNLVHLLGPNFGLVNHVFEICCCVHAVHWC